nr:hypothetical protein [Sinorhizobium saheli]
MRAKRRALAAPLTMSGSEPLGPDQRHDKVGRERERDGEADESFEH